MSNDELPKPEAKIEAPKDAKRASLALELPFEALDNAVRVVVLQHPQEPDKVLGSAALLVRGLKNSSLKVGMSWPNLSKAVGTEAIPSDWGVLYLGPKNAVLKKVCTVFTRQGDPIMQPRLKGIIVLDGTWSQAKTLWWRNAWFLKLHRIVLKPEVKSLYGNLRKEPRPDAVSTIESAALALDCLDPNGAKLKQHLDSGFALMLDTYKKNRSGPRKPSPAVSQP